ncbi:unnamed protein product [Prorocentrum cordatum]|uniref:Subtilisin n=1 Tax=Prorocentrum cordatum TaxID=2364126 RepID=A0ABN9VGF9_9DINO|nr:unnamed protein product [Polarella glacialis]
MTTTRGTDLAPRTCSTVPPARGCSSLWRVMGPQATFGNSVAVSSDGARVVVGAFYDDDQGDRSGSAYVFDGTTGERLLKLVASDGAASDHFGISVAVSSDGARVVVGAKGDDDQGNNAGSAYVLDGTTGERLLKLLANDGAAGDEFGYSVAVSSDGARVVVGAAGDEDQGDRSGSAYVFDGTTGERLLKLLASDGAAGDEFGISVSVSSDGARVVVGAAGDDDQGRQRCWLRVRARRYHRREAAQACGE